MSSISQLSGLSEIAEGEQQFYDFVGASPWRSVTQVSSSWDAAIKAKPQSEMKRRLGELFGRIAGHDGKFCRR